MPEPSQPTSPPPLRDPELNRNPTRPAGSSPGGLFAEPAVVAGRNFPTVAVGIAALAVLVALAILLLSGRRHGPGPAPANALQPLAPYASQIRFSGVELSESTSYSGGRSTFVDGHVTNVGAATLTGVTLQVLFAPEGGGAPQLEGTPLTLIRTREPYVDTEPVSAAPLGPGATADFRLIFEDVRPEWNQQPPEIHVVGVSQR